MAMGIQAELYEITSSLWLCIDGSPLPTYTHTQGPHDLRWIKHENTPPKTLKIKLFQYKEQCPVQSLFAEIQSPCFHSSWESVLHYAHEAWIKSLVCQPPWSLTRPCAFSRKQMFSSAWTKEGWLGDLVWDKHHWTDFTLLPTLLCS